MNETVVRITRVFDAPRERVFEAWSRAEHLAHWFGPRGFAITQCEADARSGGLFRVCLRSPEGRNYWVRGTYHEVLAPERLLIRCTADDHEGIPRLEEVIEVTLHAQGARTELRLLATARGLNAEAAPMVAGMDEVWAQTLSRLDTHVHPKS